MKRVKLTVEQHRKGALSLWIEHDDLGPQGRHRGGYELAEKLDHAKFYRVVARGVAGYATQGLQVDYKDIP